MQIEVLLDLNPLQVYKLIMDPAHQQQIRGAPNEFSSELSALPSSPRLPSSPPLPSYNLSIDRSYNEDKDEDEDDQTDDSEDDIEGEDTEVEDVEDEDQDIVGDIGPNSGYVQKLEYILYALRKVEWTM